MNKKNTIYEKKSEEPSVCESSIGTYAENRLHAQLKLRYAGQNGQMEVRVLGKIVDVYLPLEKKIIEIQTSAFGKIKNKLIELALEYNVTLVHPLEKEKIVVTLDKNGNELRNRKSPKHENVYSVFNELVYAPVLMAYPNISIELAFVNVNDIRIHDGKGSFRKKGISAFDREMTHFHESIILSDRKSYEALIPKELDKSFTVSELAKACCIDLTLARKMLYCYKKNFLLVDAGKRSREKLYERCF